MLAEIFSFKKLLPVLIFIGLATALYFNFSDWSTSKSYFFNMTTFDNYAILFTSLMIATVLLWMLMAGSFYKDEQRISDHLAIICFALVGGILMTSFSNLMMLFVGIETISISMYVLAAADKNSLRSNEAGLKYFLLGAFATGLLLFGIALVYGCTASFDLAAISAYASSASLPAIFYVGIIFILAGMSFKVGVIPFHWWTPDVYQGAPTAVTAFMATVVKAAAFAAFFRLFNLAFGSVAGWWIQILVFVSAITMIFGNLIAVSQTSLKRLLAYSSIAHAGYMIMAVIACNDMGARSLILYAYAYSAASLGAFAFLIILIDHLQTDHQDSLKGLAYSNPILALLLSVILISLAGIPPTAGFFAKYYLFTTLVQQGHISLVIVAVISSLIGVYFYLRPIIYMFQTNSAPLKIPASKNSIFFLSLIALVILLLGFMPQIILDII